MSSIPQKQDYSGQGRDASLLHPSSVRPRRLFKSGKHSQFTRFLLRHTLLPLWLSTMMVNVSLQLWEDKEGKKKMNKNNAKALSTLRQKIRKYNRDYETEITSYKEVRLFTTTTQDGRFLRSCF